MLHIAEQTSFEGRITEFEMQYIKIKNQSTTIDALNPNADQFTKNKILVLKANEIQFLKDKIRQIQHKQAESSKKYQQDIAVLQDCIQHQQTMIHNIKIQMVEFRGQIEQLRKDTKIVNNFVSKASELRQSVYKKQMRNTSPSFMINNNINKIKSPPKDKLPLTFSAKDARKTLYSKPLSAEDNFKNLSTVDSKRAQGHKTKK